MNKLDRSIYEEPDFYEEILRHESLDQYEGLLNYYKRNKKELKRTCKKNKK